MEINQHQTSDPRNQEQNKHTSSGQMKNQDTEQPGGKPSEKDTSRNADELQEYKDIPHPHKTQIPESDDDFKHDM